MVEKLLCPSASVYGCEECLVVKYLQLYSSGLITYSDLVHRISSSFLPRDWKVRLIQNPSISTFKQLLGFQNVEKVKIDNRVIEVKPPFIIATPTYQDFVKIKENNPFLIPDFGKASGRPVIGNTRLITYGRLLALLVDRRIGKDWTIVLTRFDTVAKIIYALCIVEGIDVVTIGFKFVTDFEVVEYTRLRTLIQQFVNDVYVSPQLDEEEIKFLNNLGSMFDRFRNRGGDIEKVLNILGLREPLPRRDPNIWWLPHIDDSSYVDQGLVQRLVQRYSLPRSLAVKLVRLKPIKTVEKALKVITIIKSYLGVVVGVEEILRELDTPIEIIRVVTGKE